MNENVKEILNRNIAPGNRQVQRAEMLVRNKVFLGELTDITAKIGEDFFKVRDLDRDKLCENSKDNILLKLDYPKVAEEERAQAKAMGLCGEYSPCYTTQDECIGRDDEIRLRVILLDFHVERWHRFCNRWGIKREWDSNITSLWNHLKNPAQMYYVQEPNSPHVALFIRVTEWTTLEDIRSIWDYVEEEQNGYWGKKELTTNFARDLIWYDLHYECKLSPSQIAKIWIERYPDVIDLLVIKRLKPRIEDNDLKGKVLDDETLLKEVKSGFLKKKYFSDFEEERKLYVTGRFKGEKKCTTDVAFIDVVKKSLKRFKKRVETVEMSPTIEVRNPLPLLSIEPIEPTKEGQKKKMRTTLLITSPLFKGGQT